VLCPSAHPVLCEKKLVIYQGVAKNRKNFSAGVIMSQLQQDLCVKFFINNQCVTKNIAPDMTALQLIRSELGLTGAKEVCKEGDCGACTIACGRWNEDKFIYHALNSCLLPAAKLHGCHVITVEGLATGDQLHPIQKLMLEHHAVQCGYCTSGMIMTLFCLFANNSAPTREAMLAALEGNLCRCTGYDAIYNAAVAVAQNMKAINQFYPPYVAEVQTQLKNIKPAAADAIVIDKSNKSLQAYHLPQSVAEMFALMEKYHDAFQIINGGTDLMVCANMQQKFPQVFIDISQIALLNFITEKADKISVGGNVNLDQLYKNALIKGKIPELQYAIARMSSQQVRNISSMAGNIANASPIADMGCVLLGLGAKIILQSKKGKREILLEDFYCDYKVTAIDAAHEIISEIEVPLPHASCSFEKTAKRSSMDIATVNSFFNVEIKSDGTIENCRIAFGGVAKFPALAKKTSKYLIGKQFTFDTIKLAADIAVQEFTPISDVRGSCEYRTLLIKNQLIKHFTRLSK
jgi:xanthine dehydrogenase small subunit